MQKDPVLLFRDASAHTLLPETLRRKQKLYENTKHMARFAERAKWKPVEGDIFEGKIMVGKGTYSHVFKAKAPNGTDDVAVKQITISNTKEGFPVTAVREIQILRNIQHMNIVRLLDVITTKGVRLLGHRRRKQEKKQLAHVEYSDVKVFMVFEYVNHDLAGLVYNPEVQLSLGNVKFIIQEILEGLKFLHDQCRLMHRDVKGSNVLISNDGDVKLGDFGLAREHKRRTKYTNRVVTLWYRAPELLLGSFKYNEKIDTWSVGCILAELLTGTPLFFAHQEPIAMNEICRVCGTPTDDNWPNFRRIPAEAIRIDPRKRNMPAVLPKTVYERRLEEEILEKRPELEKMITNTCWELLDGLLTMNPAERWGAAAALRSTWFQEDPQPEKPSFHHLEQSSHEYETRHRNRQKQDPHKPPQGHGVTLCDVPPPRYIPPPPALPQNSHDIQLQQAVKSLQNTPPKKSYDYQRDYDAEEGQWEDPAQRDFTTTQSQENQETAVDQLVSSLLSSVTSATQATGDRRRRRRSRSRSASTSRSQSSSRKRRKRRRSRSRSSERKRRRSRSSGRRRRRSRSRSRTRKKRGRR